MKIKVLNNLIVTLLTLLSVPPVWGQGTVSTRKYRFSDFTDKVTQVVLSENEMLSGALRQEVVGGWTASAFEFCTLEQFEQLKSSPQYYFLIAAESRFKGEETPGILFLTLVKGGPEAAKGIGEMDEVISLPLSNATGGNGRELLYLGPLLQAIQEFTLAALESERTAYSRDTWFNMRMDKRFKTMEVVFAREDLAESVDEAFFRKTLGDGCRLADAEEADAAFARGDAHTLVSYTVAPFLPSEGSYCYKMLFEATSHQLYYIVKHKITPAKGEGFLPEDLRRLSRKR